MGDDSVSDVDREVVGRIARASLRHEEKVPGTVVARVSLRGGGQGNKRDCGCHAQQRILHHHISEALSALPRIYGKEGRERLPLGGVADRHVHPVEPLALRLTLAGRF